MENFRKEGLKEKRRVEHFSWAAEVVISWLDASHWKPAQGLLPRQLLWSYVQGTSDLPFHELSWLQPG